MSLATLAFVLTALCYLVAGGFFSAHLRNGSERAAFWATRTLGLSIVAHVAFVCIDYVLSGRAPLGSMHQTLALLSLLIAVGFLGTMRRHRLPVLGAFITPVTLLLFLGAGFQGAAPGVPESVRSALLPVHIAVNVLGLAAFALAFGAAVAYLMQERMLRRRQLSGAFQRLPALDVLDAVGFRLVTVGFTLFTFGVVTGTIWASRAGTSFSTGQGFALFSWLCFAVVLLARVAGGWRGRRAAIGTMLGFLGAMAAVGGYLLRGVGG
jgi:ABC-type uncharacterized transport system permease subunit